MITLAVGVLNVKRSWVYNMDKFNPTKYKNQFNKDTYDNIRCVVPKGMKEQLKKALDGKSVNSFLNEVIQRKIEGN